MKNYYDTTGMSPLKEMMPGYPFPDEVASIFDEYRWIFTGVMNHPTVDTFYAFAEANNEIERRIASMRGMELHEDGDESLEKVSAEFKSDVGRGQRPRFDRILGDHTLEDVLGGEITRLFRRVDTARHPSPAPSTSHSRILEKKDSQEAGVDDIAAIGRAFGHMRDSAVKAFQQPMTIEQRKLAQVRIDLLTKAAEYAQRQREFDPQAKTDIAL